MFFAMAKAIQNICGHNKKRLLIIEGGPSKEKDLLIKTLEQNKKDFNAAMQKINAGRHTGKIWITNGKTNIRIYPTELIPAGFVRGKTIYDKIALSKKLKISHHSQKDYVWVTNGKINKFVHKDCIPVGFSRGQMKNEKLYTRHLGKIWVTDGIHNKFIHPDLIPAGYFKGRTLKKS